MLWTAAVCFVDVQAIGPQESTVGFATLNTLAHSIIGVNMYLYIITDWFSLVPLGFAAGFALLGLTQWIKRKHLSKVDFSILVLGGFYMLVIALYICFEIFPLNYRPVLLNGYLESSYPSSTTMLVMSVMPTSIMQFNTRIKNAALKRWSSFAITTFVILMVICRLLSGVHWVTDIVGGALLSAGLVLIYSSIVEQSHHHTKGSIR